MPLVAASLHEKALPLLLLTGLLAAACGGGGGGGGNPSEPRPPAPSPVPVDPPPQEPVDGSTARILLENGATATDGFVVGNIEDAALDARGNVALIASSDRDSHRAVLRRDTSGRLTTIFDRFNASEEIDLATLSRVRMASSGEVAFQSGAGIDTDQLHLAIGDEVHTVAGGAGAVAPEFRMLGNFRMARGGLVAFIAGGEECEREASGETFRDLCTLSLFLANGSEVVRIDHEDFELDRRQPNDGRIALNENGELYFSVPGRRESPTIVRWNGEEAEAILRNRGEIAEGVVARIDIVDLDEEGRLLVEVGFPPEIEDDPIRDHVGLLEDDHFVDFAVEGVVEGDRSVFALRGVGLGGGLALFEATLVDSVSGEQSACLRLGDETAVTEIVCENAPFPGERREVFSISGTRINSAGDVLFVVELGTRTADTVQLEEIRAVVRRADGELVTIVSSLDSDSLGVVSSLTTVGLNDAGQALLIAERTRANDRVLLLGDSR